LTDITDNSFGTDNSIEITSTFIPQLHPESVKTKLQAQSLNFPQATQKIAGKSLKTETKNNTTNEVPFHQGTRTILDTQGRDPKGTA
jgi:hypothetical protein